MVDILHIRHDTARHAVGARLIGCLSTITLDPVVVLVSLEDRRLQLVIPLVTVVAEAITRWIIQWTHRVALPLLEHFARHLATDCGEIVGISGESFLLLRG